MYSPFRHLGSVVWKRRPIQLTFFVTRRCNLRCPFCFYLSAADARPDGPELSLDEIERISRSVGPLLWLAFSGGEVFLRNDLVDISRRFHANTRAAIMLYSTNGQLPDLTRERTEEILRACPRSIIVVKLSLDGLRATHDALRDKPGAFDAALATYHRLEALLDRYPHFELGINTVLCSENQAEMGAVVDFVRGLGRVRTHTISLIRGNLLHPDFKNVEPACYEDAIGRLETLLKRDRGPRYRFRGARLKAAQDLLQRRLILRTLTAQRRLTACYAGRLNVVLTETGEVYPCELRRESFGNVRDFGYDVRAMLRSAPATAITRSIRSGACFCTHERYAMTNILFNPAWYPALLKEYARLR